MAPSRRIRQIFAPGEFTATTTIFYKSATLAIDNTPPNIIATSPKPLSDFERKLTAGGYGRPGNITKLNPVAVAFKPKSVVDGSSDGEEVGTDEEVAHHAVCDVLNVLIARCAGKGMKASKWAS